MSEIEQLPKQFFGITAHSRDTINHIAAEVSHDFRCAVEEDNIADKVRWNNRCVVGLLIKITEQREELEKSSAREKILADALRSASSELWTLLGNFDQPPQYLVRKLAEWEKLSPAAQPRRVYTDPAEIDAAQAHLKAAQSKGVKCRTCDGVGFVLGDPCPDCIPAQPKGGPTDVDPGEGWRLLGQDEVLQEGDEFYRPSTWTPTICQGETAKETRYGHPGGPYIYRRRTSAMQEERA